MLLKQNRLETGHFSIRIVGVVLTRGILNWTH